MSNSKEGFLTHIALLRVVGVVLVLAYHLSFITGGFFGVDIFFVFSGYLITALAIKETESSHSFSMARFINRRFFRIFPTLFVAVLIMTPLMLLGDSDLRFNLLQQTFAGLGFVTNLYELSTGASYGTSAAPHVWVHLWSLAIEVQFYIFWGIVLWLVSQLSHDNFKRIIRLISMSLFIISATVWMSLSPKVGNLSELYYMPGGHFFGFFAGAMFATFQGITQFERKSSHTLINWIGVVISAVLILWMSVTFKFETVGTFQYGFLLSTGFTVGLLYFLRQLDHSDVKPMNSVLVYIANVSYGVYIYHWPLIVLFLNLKISHSITVPVVLIISFAFASLQYFVIDQIVAKWRGKGIVTKSVSVVAIMTLLGVGGYTLTQTSYQTKLQHDLSVGINQQTVNALNQKYQVKKVVPKHNETSNDTVDLKGRELLVIGDSVTMGTEVDYGGSPLLSNEIPGVKVDAMGDRKLNEALSGAPLDEINSLPKDSILVIAIGTNSVDPAMEIKELDKFLSDYKDKLNIVLLTPSNQGEGGPFNSDQIADHEVSLKQKYKTVKIADWRALSRGHREWFNADSIHISDSNEGRQAWIDLIKKTIAEFNE